MELLPSQVSKCLSDNLSCIEYVSSRQVKLLLDSFKPITTVKEMQLLWAESTICKSIAQKYSLKKRFYFDMDYNRMSDCQ